MNERAGGCVFLLTDYGLKDEFAGVLKAVVARFAPEAALVDLTHGVPAFDVRAGALALVRAVPHLGRGVVLAVVDPGVAGERRAVALEVGPRSVSGSEPRSVWESPSGSGPRSVWESPSGSGPSHLVGPDNGLLVWAAEALGGVSRAVELHASVSRSTFDGRDLFAPAAASLWRGIPLDEIGTPVDPGSLFRLAQPSLSVSPGSIEAEVLWVDAFGNVQLSAKPEDAVKAGVGDRAGEDLYVVTHGGQVGARRVAAFCDVTDGGLGLLVDSNGHLSLAGDRSSAALTLMLRAGDHVKLVSRLPTDASGARTEMNQGGAG